MIGISINGGTVSLQWVTFGVGAKGWESAGSAGELLCSLPPSYVTHPALSVPKCCRICTVQCVTLLCITGGKAALQGFMSGVGGVLWGAEGLG